MKRVLIYSGTTEGRMLAEQLAEARIASVVSVATEYGELVMESSSYIEVRRGRLSLEEMCALMQEESFEAVVDATHPFATVVTETIAKSVAECNQGIPLYRLRRDTRADIDFEKAQEVQYCKDVTEAVAILKNTTGNILLTTGSKDLEHFAAEQKLTKRLYARVLPSVESITLCAKQGLEGKQVIAMQGPFSVEMNRAILEQYQIQVMVTKESGRTGGLDEKLEAARSVGALCLVIGSPKEEHTYSFAQVRKLLLERYGCSACKELTLVGIGMGNAKTLTQEATEAIQKAECIYGAKRLLHTVKEWTQGKRTYPYYLAKDILPSFGESESQRAVVLFSGDSGFYSGTQKLYEAVKQDTNWKVTILPGISSISYLAAKSGIAWQDAKIVSLHGKEEALDELIDSVRYGKKVFSIFSGREQLIRGLARLQEEIASPVTVWLGYQLSYAEESIFTGTLSDVGQQLQQMEKEGLFSAFFLAEKVEGKRVTHGRKDTEFIRAKVPMTKEEIRMISIAKLALQEGDVVYDIGAGTGSIAMEVGSLSKEMQVYAFECKEEAIPLLEENKKQFGLHNVTIMQTMVPEGLEELPAPDAVFIGGSKGNLKEILVKLAEKNPNCRIVINAIALETVAQFTRIPEWVSVAEFEIVTVQVARSHALGNYHLMQSENPITICSFTLAERK